MAITKTWLRQYLNSTRIENCNCHVCELNEGGTCSLDSISIEFGDNVAFCSNCIIEGANFEKKI